jgi:hypothetical protein
VDGAGNVYVADRFNNSIRKATPSGLVSTLAGSAQGWDGFADGPGKSALFRQPVDVAVDEAGNVYVADLNNYLTRKVTPTGVVTTLAGLPSNPGSADGTGNAARFSGPSGVAVDTGGNVYVADTYNHTIRKVTPWGVVTTIAGVAGSFGSADGTGSDARLNHPVGVCVDTAGNVFVADADNHTVRKVTSAGAVTTVAGMAGGWGYADGTGSAASFNHPYGVAVDGTGNVYVADSGNNALRKVTPSGVVTTLRNSGWADGSGTVARFEGPLGIAVDTTSNVYVAEFGNHTIRKVTPAGEVTTLAGLAGSFGWADGTGSAARFNNPYGVAVDGAANVYVADSGNQTIRKVTPSGVVTTLAGLAGSFGWADGPGNDARFNNPSGVAADGAGNIYVAEMGNQLIRKVASSSLVTTLAGLTSRFGSTDGTGIEARFYLPSGITVDRANNVFVADRYNNTIRKVTMVETNWVVTTVAGLSGISGSTDGTGSAVRFDQPCSVAVDNAGNIYVADTYNHTIRKGIRTTSILTASLGFGGAVFRFDVTGPYGRALVVDASTNLVNWLPIMTNIFGTGPLPFSDPQSGMYSRRYYRARTL